jgi:hypothetical protein
VNIHTARRYPRRAKAFKKFTSVYNRLLSVYGPFTGSSNARPGGARCVFAEIALGADGPAADERVAVISSNGNTTTIDLDVAC